MIEITENKTTKLPGTSSLYVSFKYNKEVIKYLKLCETYEYNSKTHVWEVPVTSLSFLVDRLSYVDDIELHFLKRAVATRDVQYELMEYKTKPFPHQVENIQYALNHDSFLLLDDPGLGKSLSIIRIAEELKKRDKLEHCLIICGYNALKTNWEKEIQKHSNLSCRIVGKKINSKGRMIFTSIPERLEELKAPIKEFFIIINVESLRDSKIVKALNDTKVNRIGMIAFDEAHVLANPSSMQAKGFLKLKAAHKIAATGTLLTNSPLNAHTPLKWIGAEHGDMTHFKHYYGNYVGQKRSDLVGYRHLDLLQNQIEHNSIRHTKELLKLPEKTVIDEYVDMSEIQAKFYQDVVDGIIAEVDKVKLTMSNTLAMVTRLRQATALPAILTTSEIPSAKIDRACELARNLVEGGEKVVIFSVYKPVIEAMKERLEEFKPVVCTGDVPDAEIEENKQLFQEDDEHMILFATSQKLGVGVTLTRASYAVFIDTPWTAAGFEQAQDRIHRIGSERPVFIYNLITSGTVDEKVKEIVEMKGLVSDYVIDDKIPPLLSEKLKSVIQDLKWSEE